MPRGRRSRFLPTGGLLLTLVGLGPAARAADPPAASAEAPTFAVIAALPGDKAAGIRIEAGLLFKDLRVYQTWGKRRRALRMQTLAGARFFAPGVQKEAFGADFFAELVRILDLAAPGPDPIDETFASPDPVPAAVVTYTYPGGIAIQGMMRVSPGFLDRIAAVLDDSGSDPPAWHGRVRDGRLEIDVGDRKLLGVVGEDGWLRLAPGEEMLHSAGDGAALFTGTMRRWAESHDSLLFVRGGGIASFALAALIEDPTLRDLVLTMKAAVVSWQFDGDKTVAVRGMLDAPQLLGWRLALRRPNIENTLVDLWDESATSFLSVSLPQPALDAAIPWVEQQVRNTTPELELPALLRDALGNAAVVGRVGIAWFGAPGDWALGLQFADPAAAQTAVPAFEQWGAALAKKSASSLGAAYALEDFPGASGKVLLSRPDVDLEGLRLAAVGSTLVAVNQKSRLSALLSHRTARGLPGQKHPSIRNRLTPMISELLARPTMLLAYMVLGDDGELLDWATWLAAAVRESWGFFVKERPELAFVDPLLRRLPTVLALESFNWALTYDIALAADIEDSLLIVQLLGSEI